jgi:hypothetical protein
VASESDSSRCSECVDKGRSDCDIFGLSRSQLLKIADRHSSLESELEVAEEEAEKLAAKVRRLRREKKLWFKRLSQAVSRGLDSVEELEALERREEEESRSSEAAAALTTADPSAGEFLLFLVYGRCGPVTDFRSCARDCFAWLRVAARLRLVGGRA